MDGKVVGGIVILTLCLSLWKLARDWVGAELWHSRDGNMGSSLWKCLLNMLYIFLVLTPYWFLKCQDILHPLSFPRLVIVWQCLNPECTVAKKALLKTADNYSLSYYGMEPDTKRKRKVKIESNYWCFLKVYICFLIILSLLDMWDMSW